MTTQNYPYRWLVKSLEVMLVMAIVIFSFDALNDFFTPLAEDSASYYDSYYSQNDATHTLYWEARRQASAENYADAFVYYSEAINEDSRYAAPYLGRGIVQEKRGDYTAAARDFYQYMMYTHTHRYETPTIALSDETLTETLTLNMHEGRVFAIPLNITSDEQMIDIAVSSYSADPIFVLVSPDNEILTGSDDSYAAQNRDSIYRQFESMDANSPEITLTETGWHTLLVSHAGGGSYGRVTVTITSTPSS